MNKLNLFLLPALAFFACAGLQAQVTIGGLTDPAPGALLDLNGTGGVKGGLLLSNVTITDLGKIPAGTNSFPGIIAGDNDGNNPGFKGAIVYNTNPDTGVGVYVWTGTQWIPAGTSILYDAEGNDYAIGYFGTAGTWMTQNLRTTTKDYGNNTYLGEGPSLDITHKRYTYPGTSDNHDIRKGMLSPEQLEVYGLLYSWAAASGRTDADDDDGKAGFGDKAPTKADYHQGICPDGWHLPSDYEWSQLEQEIASNPSKYSSQTDAYSESYPFFPAIAGDGFVWRPGNTTGQLETYWGRQMKSATPVTGTDPKGSSFPREKGGLDIPLVGGVWGNDIHGNYGLDVGLWSSSSYSGTYGVSRILYNNYTGMRRNAVGKELLYTVRCKKD